MNTKRDIAAEMFKRAQENARLQRMTKSDKDSWQQTPVKKKP